MPKLLLHPVIIRQAEVPLPLNFKSNYEDYSRKYIIF